MNEFSKLEEAAKEATPGPYLVDNCGDLRHEDGSGVLLSDDLYQRNKNADFIALANPTAILSLIAAHRKALEDLELSRFTIKELHERNYELWSGQLGRETLTELNSLHAKLTKAKAALEYYACPDHYEKCVTLGGVGIRTAGVLVEHGDKARAALKELECQA